MHICFISHEYPIWHSGGIGIFIQTIGKAFVLQGIQVSVLGIGVSRQEQIFTENGIKIYRLPKSSFPALKFVQNFYRINNKLRYLNNESRIDIVETTEAGLAFINKKKGIKYIIRMHGGHQYLAKTLGKRTSFWKSFQEYLSFRKSDSIIAVSDYVGSRTFELLNLQNRTFKIIYNPIQIPILEFSDIKVHDLKTILYFGTVYETKGVANLISAIKILRNKYHDISLDIVGRDTVISKSGATYIEWLKSEMDADLLNRVKFHGSVQHDNIWGWIKNADIVVLPSLIEAFGISAIEALSMQKPLIFTKQGPGPEVVKDGVTGLLCDPFSPESIAEKIAYMIENPSLALKMAINGRNDVEKRFNIEMIVKENISYYRSV